MDLLIFIFSVVIVGLFYLILQYVLEKRAIRIINKLIEFNFDKKSDFFDASIAIIDHAILSKWNTKRTINYFLVNKSSVLFDMGRFDEVIRMDGIENKYLDSHVEKKYYKNLILSLYFSGQTERANSYVSEIADLYNFNAYATFFNDKYEVSEKLIKDLMLNDITEKKIVEHYLLGVIKYKQNSVRESEEQFNYIIKAGNRNFFYEKANEFLNIIRNEDSKN